MNGSNGSSLSTVLVAWLCLCWWSASGLAETSGQVLPGGLGLQGNLALTMPNGPLGGSAADLDEQDDTALFVVGNTLFAVYHELAHGLIDLLELPVIGREEDAADGFAAMMMIPPAPDPLLDELIIAVADGWRLQGDQAGGGADQGPLWAEHALDEQRYFAVVCWMVGSDQEGFFDFAAEAGMPAERIASCADDFERMQASWEGLLGAHLIKANGANSGIAGRIDVVFDQPSQDDVEALSWARTGQVIERSIVDFSQTVALPNDIAVRFQSCGDANAFWHGDRLEVQICYGLVDDFLSLLLGRGAR